jgi:lipopolysaccharide export system protein LptA
MSLTSIRKHIVSNALALCLVILPQIPVLGQTKKIDILNADIIQADSKLGPGGQKLIGEVRFKHEDAIMTCDSAYFFARDFTLDAFSNVSIVQGDTLFLYGDKLHYEGEEKLAQFRRNVKLIDDSTVLLTDFLDYNRESEIAHYFNGGNITQGENKLSSDEGYYHTGPEIFIFRDSVVVINPDYTIYSDTLKYNTRTEVSYFFGPTEIIGKNNYIYCENGWYDSEKDISLVNRNAWMKNDSRTLFGDTLYYERRVGFGKATSNVRLVDSLKNITLTGNLGLYYENEELATLTDSALMIQADNAGDTLYVHADTIRSIIDTARTDNSKIILAYKHVKIFREDMQGMCDSLAYFEYDSIFHLFGSPILWSEENQLTATKIELQLKKGQLHSMCEIRPS